MADPAPPAAPDLGAPIAKDAIDPDLIRLQRRRPKVGVITAAGIVFLCAFFLYRLSPDRRFGGAGDPPTPRPVGDVLAGKVDADAFVAVDAEPLMSHAIRASQAKGNLGLRVAPARGTGDLLWLVLPGDGWSPPSTEAHAGRLRRLRDLPFAAAVREYAAAHPRPRFAAASAVRAGLAAGKVATVGGEEVTPRDDDQVALDVVDPDAATIFATFNDRLPDAAAWSAALTAAGVTTPAPAATTAGQARYDLTLPNAGGAVATLTTRLEAAHLWAARVEPVTHHFDTTWKALRGSPPTGFSVGAATIPDAELDLVGLYVARDLPDDAWALVTTERPADYWYVMPISVAVAALGLLFAWALARAIKRDLMAPRA